MAFPTPEKRCRIELAMVADQRQIPKCGESGRPAARFDVVIHFPFYCHPFSCDPSGSQPGGGGTAARKDVIPRKLRRTRWNAVGPQVNLDKAFWGAARCLHPHTPSGAP